MSDNKVVHFVSVVASSRLIRFGRYIFPRELLKYEPHAKLNSIEKKSLFVNSRILIHSVCFGMDPNVFFSTLINKSNKYINNSN